MKNQKGGVKKKNPGKLPQNILHDTLQSNGVFLNVISDGSYKSFVLEIIINDPDAREYIATDEGGSFRNPVERLVMKILITYPRSGGSFDEYVDMNNVHRSKASETPDEIIAEAKVQQEAWIKTVVKGRVPVCPSVADLIFFDNQNGKNFITYLQTKFAAGNARIHRVSAYILDNLQKIPACGICVMVMPEVSAPAQVLTAAAPAQTAAAPAQAAAAPPQASITLQGFLNLPDGSNFQGLIVDKDLKNTAYSLITACVMRLFWAGIIDFDLHDNNFILYVDENGELQGKIIDLGNSIIFTEGPNKFLVHEADIDTLTEKLEIYKNGIISNIADGTHNRKKEFIVEMLDMIKTFDTIGNQQVFPHIHRFHSPDDSINCQMSWWQDIKDKEIDDEDGLDYSFSDIIDNAYKFAQDGFMVDIGARNSGVSRKTIEKYIKEGKLPGFHDIAPVGWPWVVGNAQGAQGQGEGQGAQAQGFAGQAQGQGAQGAQAQGQGAQGQGAQGQGAQGVPTTSSASTTSSGSPGWSWVVGNAQGVPTTSSASTTSSGSSTGSSIGSSTGSSIGSSTGSSGYFSSSASNSEPTINYFDAERGYGWGGGARKQSRRKQSRRKQSRRKQSRRKQSRRKQSKKRRRTSKK